MRKQWTTAALAISLGLAAPAFAQDDTMQAPVDKPSPAETERDAAQTTDLNGEEYVVQTGDTLSGIAERFLGSADQWQQIAQANDIQNPDMLSVGMKLEIPQGASEPTSQPESRAPSGTTLPAPSEGADETDLPSDDDGAMPPDAR
jgi:nucleoid-associated protein YgaU